MVSFNKISESLMNFFLTSLNLIETSKNPSRNLENTNKKEIIRMVNEGYIPLITLDKIKYIRNLSSTYIQLKSMSSEILNELEVNSDLPPSYNIAIVTHLAILESWRKIITEKIAFSTKVKIYEDDDSLQISPYTLLFLYRFVILSKFASTGNSMVKMLRIILETPENLDKFGETYNEIKKLIDKNGKRTRKEYAMFNTLFMPLVISYALNGANLVRYYKGKEQNQLAYASTALMELLGTYSFRVFFAYPQTTLKLLAEQLAKYFKVINSVILNKEFKSILKEGSLYGYLVTQAGKYNLDSMTDISILWDILNNIVLAMLVSLEFYNNEDELRSIYREKVGNINLHEYVTRQYIFS
ncbi:MAG: hypothetical protein RXR43_13050 [Sulfolobus sp.]